MGSEGIGVPPSVSKEEEVVYTFIGETELEENLELLGRYGGGGDNCSKRECPNRIPCPSRTKCPPVVSKDVCWEKIVKDLKCDLQTLNQYEKSLCRCPAAGVPTFEPCFLITKMMCKVDKLERQLKKEACRKMTERGDKIKAQCEMLKMLRCMKVIVCEEIKKPNNCPVDKQKLCYLIKCLEFLEKQVCEMSKDLYLESQSSKKTKSKNSSKCHCKPKDRSSKRHSAPDGAKLNTSKHLCDPCCNGDSVSRRKSSKSVCFGPKPCCCKPCCCKKKKECSTSTSKLDCLPQACKEDKKSYEVTSLHLVYEKTKVSVCVPEGMDYNVDMTEKRALEDCFGVCEEEDDQENWADKVAEKSYKKQLSEGVAESTLKESPDGNILFTLKYERDTGTGAPCGKNESDKHDGHPLDEFENKVKGMTNVWIDSAKKICDELIEKHQNTISEKKPNNNSDC